MAWQPADQIFHVCRPRGVKAVIESSALNCGITIQPQLYLQSGEDGPAECHIPTISVSPVGLQPRLGTEVSALRSCFQFVPQNACGLQECAAITAIVHNSPLKALSNMAGSKASNSAAVSAGRRFSAST